MKEGNRSFHSSLKTKCTLTLNQLEKEKRLGKLNRNKAMEGAVSMGQKVSMVIKDRIEAVISEETLDNGSSDEEDPISNGFTFPPDSSNVTKIRSFEDEIKFQKNAQSSEVFLRLYKKNLRKSMFKYRLSFSNGYVARGNEFSLGLLTLDNK